MLVFSCHSLRAFVTYNKDQFTPVEVNGGDEKVRDFSLFLWQLILYAKILFFFFFIEFQGCELLLFNGIVRLCTE